MSMAIPEVGLSIESRSPELVAQARAAVPSVPLLAPLRAGFWWRGGGMRMCGACGAS